MRREPLTIGTPTLWAVGCIVVLASPGLISHVIAQRDRVLHDTYFVAVHWHWALALAAVFGFFAGWYYLFPQAARRLKRARVRRRSTQGEITRRIFARALPS